MNDTTNDPVHPTDVDEDLLSSWSFDLPADRIATHPLAVRSASRLLHLDERGVVHHRTFADLIETLLHPGDVLVVNDTSVIPARLRGEKAGSGGKGRIAPFTPVPPPAQFLARRRCTSWPRRVGRALWQGAARQSLKCARRSCPKGGQAR